LHNAAIDKNAEEIDFKLANLPETLNGNWVTNDGDDNMQDYSDDDTSED
jgi:hypothetical protein